MNDASIIVQGKLLEKVPEGYFLLCDGGGALSRKLLTPYDNVRYHIKEFRGAAARPSTTKEVFNHLCASCSEFLMTKSHLTYHEMQAFRAPKWTY
jgi:hypothetical protein